MHETSDTPKTWIEFADNWMPAILAGTFIIACMHFTLSIITGCNT